MNKYRQKVTVFILITTMTLASVPSFSGGALSGGSTEWTQVANNFELAASVETQIRTYSDIASQLQLAKNNIQSIRQSFLGNQASALLRLSNAVKRDGELGRSAVYTLERMDEVYPGYLKYLEDSDPEQTKETYAAWDNRSRENVRAALEGIGANRAELVTEGQVIRKLQAQSQSAVGQKQALQVGNEIALAQMAQNQRLQILLERQIELQANYQLEQQDIKEKGRAASDRLNDWELPEIGDLKRIGDPPPPWDTKF